MNATGSHYRRILLKLSGEVLMGPKPSGLDPETVRSLALEIKGLRESGIEVALVIGGGNIFRGLAASELGMDRVTADHMGMLATVINCLALQDSLERWEQPVRTMTAIHMRGVAEPFIRRRAIRHLEKGRIVVFAAGTGNPFFTTDTAAALRASEVHADAIFKATKVDGVYDKDPQVHPDAQRFERITYAEALQRRLRVMDSTAFSLCMENRIPVVVFDVRKPGNIKRAVAGEPIGTTVEA